MSGMVARVKYTLHPGATSAILKVDGVAVVDDVIARSFPCPLDRDIGKSCLDITMPAGTEPGHIFHTILIENPGGIVTTISMPASAPTGSLWHPINAPNLMGIALVGAFVVYYGQNHGWFHRIRQWVSGRFRQPIRKGKMEYHPRLKKKGK